MAMSNSNSMSASTGEDEPAVSLPLSVAECLLRLADLAPPEAMREGQASDVEWARMQIALVRRGAGRP